MLFDKNYLAEPEHQFSENFGLHPLGIKVNDPSEEAGEMRKEAISRALLYDVDPESKKWVDHNLGDAPRGNMGLYEAGVAISREYGFDEHPEHYFIGQKLPIPEAEKQSDMYIALGKHRQGVLLDSYNEEKLKQSEKQKRVAELKYAQESFIEKFSKRGKRDASEYEPNGKYLHRPIEHIPLFAPESTPLSVSSYAPSSAHLRITPSEYLWLDELGVSTGVLNRLEAGRTEAFTDMFMMSNDDALRVLNALELNKPKDEWTKEDKFVHEVFSKAYYNAWKKNKAEIYGQKGDSWFENWVSKPAANTLHKAGSAMRSMLDAGIPDKSDHYEIRRKNKEKIYGKKQLSLREFMTGSPDGYSWRQDRGKLGNVIWGEPVNRSNLTTVEQESLDKHIALSELNHAPKDEHERGNVFRAELRGMKQASEHDFLKDRQSNFAMDVSVLLGDFVGTSLPAMIPYAGVAFLLSGASGQARDEGLRMGLNIKDASIRAGVYGGATTIAEKASFGLLGKMSWADKLFNKVVLGVTSKAMPKMTAVYLANPFAQFMGRTAMGGVTEGVVEPIIESSLKLMANPLIVEKGQTSFSAEAKGIADSLTPEMVVATLLFSGGMSSLNAGAYAESSMAYRHNLEKVLGLGGTHAIYNEARWIADDNARLSFVSKAIHKEWKSDPDSAYSRAEKQGKLRMKHGQSHALREMESFEVLQARGIMPRVDRVDEDKFHVYDNSRTEQGILDKTAKAGEDAAVSAGAKPSNNAKEGDSVELNGIQLDKYLTYALNKHHVAAIQWAQEMLVSGYALEHMDKSDSWRLEDIGDTETEATLESLGKSIDLHLRDLKAAGLSEKQALQTVVPSLSENIPLGQLALVAGEAQQRMEHARQRGEAKEGQTFASNAYTVRLNYLKKHNITVLRYAKGKAKPQNLWEEMSEKRAEDWEAGTQDRGLVAFGDELQDAQREVSKSHPDAPRFIQTEKPSSRRDVLEAMSSMAVLDFVLKAAKGGASLPSSLTKMASHMINAVEAFNSAIQLGEQIKALINNGKLSEEVQGLLKNMGQSIEDAYIQDRLSTAEEQARLNIALNEHDMRANNELGTVDIQALKSRVKEIKEQAVVNIDDEASGAANFSITPFSIEKYRENDLASVSKIYGTPAPTASQVSKVWDDTLNLLLDVDVRNPYQFYPVCPTPAVLQMVGASSHMMGISQTCVDKVMGGAHQIKAEQLFILPEQLSDPVAVFASSTQGNSFVVLTEMQENGAPVIAAIHLDVHKKHTGIIINKIASVYGKNNREAFKDMKPLYKKKSLLPKKGRGLQLPTEFSNREKGFKDNIKTEDDLVKYKEDNGINFSITQPLPSPNGEGEANFNITEVDNKTNINYDKLRKKHANEWIKDQERRNAHERASGETLNGLFSVTENVPNNGGDLRGGESANDNTGRGDGGANRNIDDGVLDGQRASWDAVQPNELQGTSGLRKNVNALHLTKTSLASLNSRRLSFAQKHQQQAKELGFYAGDILELPQTLEGAKAFQQAIQEGSAAHPYGECVYVYDTEDYQAMRLFLTPDGMAGIALKEGGDMVSVFRHPSQGKDGGKTVPALISAAISSGAIKADCYGRTLSELYGKMGFRPAIKDSFTTEFIDNPESIFLNGDKMLEAFPDEKGEPPVYYLVYTGNHDSIFGDFDPRFKIAPDATPDTTGAVHDGDTWQESVDAQDFAIEQEKSKLQKNNADVNFSIVNQTAAAQANELLSPLLTRDLRARAVVRALNSSINRWNLVAKNASHPEEAARAFGELNTLLAEVLQILPAQEKFIIRTYQKLAVVLSRALESGKVRNFGQLRKEQFAELVEDFEAELGILGVDGQLDNDAQRVSEAKLLVAEAKSALNAARAKSKAAILEPHAELELARQQRDNQKFEDQQEKSTIGVAELEKMAKAHQQRLSQLEAAYSAAQTKAKAAKRKHQSNKDKAKETRASISEVKEQGSADATKQKEALVAAFVLETKERDNQLKAEQDKLKAERIRIRKEYQGVIALYKKDYDIAKELLKEAKESKEDNHEAKAFVREAKSALDAVRAEAKEELLFIDGELDLLKHQRGEQAFADEKALETCGLEEAKQIIASSQELASELEATCAEARQKAQDAKAWGNIASRKTSEAKKEASQYKKTAKNETKQTKQRLLEAFKSKAAQRLSELNKTYAKAQLELNRIKQEAATKEEAAKAEYVAAKEILEEAKAQRLTKADIQELIASIAEGKLFTLVQRIFKDTRAHLETQIKKEMEERVFAHVAKLLPKKGSSGKLSMGKMNADSYRHLHLILSMVEASVEEVEMEQARVMTMLQEMDKKQDESKAQEDGEFKDSTVPYSYDGVKLKLDRDSLEYVANNWMLFGNLKGMKLEASTLAMKELIEFVNGARAEWQAKKDLQRKQVRTLANAFITGVNRLRAKKGLKNVSAQSVKDVKSAAGRGMALVSGQVSEFRNFAQTVGLLGKMPEVAPYIKEVINGMAAANVELSTRENQDTVAISLMVAKVLGIELNEKGKLDWKGKRQVNKWLRESKKNQKTGAIMHHKASKTISMSYADAADWLLMSNAEADAKREAIKKNAKALKVDPYMEGYVEKSEVSQVFSVIKERIINNERSKRAKEHNAKLLEGEERMSADNVDMSDFKAGNSQMLEYLDKRKEESKFDVAIQLETKTEELRLTKEQAMYQILLYEQDRYKQNFEANGYEADTIEALYRFIAEDGLAIAYALREYVHENGLEFAEVYERNMGVPFPAEENYFVARFNHADTGNTEGTIEGGGASGGVRYRSLKLRSNHKAAPDLSIGAFNATLATLAEQNNYIFVSGITSKLRSVIAIPSARDAIKTYLGDHNYDLLKRWVDIIDNAGVSDAQALANTSRWVNLVNSTRAHVWLSYKTVTLIKQLSGILNPIIAGEINPFQLLAAYAKMLTGQGHFSLKRISQTNALQARTRNNPILRQMMTMPQDTIFPALQSFAQGGLIALEHVDAIVNTVAFTAYANQQYEVIKKQNEQNEKEGAPSMSEAEMEALALD